MLNIKNIIIFEINDHFHLPFRIDSFKRATQAIPQKLAEEGFTVNHKMLAKYRVSRLLNIFQFLALARI